MSAVICGRSQQVPIVGVRRYQFSELAGTRCRSQLVSVVGDNRYQWSEPAEAVIGVGRYPLSESAGISAEPAGTIGRS